MKTILISLALAAGLGCQVNGGASLSLKDPVCGVTCYGDKCEQETRDGKQFYFCGKECQKKFDQDPNRYTTSP